MALRVLNQISSIKFIQTGSIRSESNDRTCSVSPVNNKINNNSTILKHITANNHMRRSVSQPPTFATDPKYIYCKYLRDDSYNDKTRGNENATSNTKKTSLLNLLTNNQSMDDKHLTALGYSKQKMLVSGNTYSGTNLSRNKHYGGIIMKPDIFNKVSSFMNKDDLQQDFDTKEKIIKQKLVNIASGCIEKDDVDKAISLLKALKSNLAALKDSKSFAKAQKPPIYQIQQPLKKQQPKKKPKREQLTIKADTNQTPDKPMVPWPSYTDNLKIQDDTLYESSNLQGHQNRNYSTYLKRMVDTNETNANILSKLKQTQQRQRRLGDLGQRNAKNKNNVLNNWLRGYTNQLIQDEVMGLKTETEGYSDTEDNGRAVSNISLKEKSRNKYLTNSSQRSKLCTDEEVSGNEISEMFLTVENKPVCETTKVKCKTCMDGFVEKDGKSVDVKVETKPASVNQYISSKNSVKDRYMSAKEETVAAKMEPVVKTGRNFKRNDLKVSKVPESRHKSISEETKRLLTLRSESSCMKNHDRYEFTENNLGKKTNEIKVLPTAESIDAKLDDRISQSFKGINRYISNETKTASRDNQYKASMEDFKKKRMKFDTIYANEKVNGTNMQKHDNPSNINVYKCFGSTVNDYKKPLGFPKIKPPGAKREKLETKVSRVHKECRVIQEEDVPILSEKHIKPFILNSIVREKVVNYRKPYNVMRNESFRNLSLKDVKQIEPNVMKPEPANIPNDIFMESENKKRTWKTHTPSATEAIYKQMQETNNRSFINTSSPLLGERQLPISSEIPKYMSSGNSLNLASKKPIEDDYFCKTSVSTKNCKLENRIRLNQANQLVKFEETKSKPLNIQTRAFGTCSRNNCTKQWSLSSLKHRLHRRRGTTQFTRQYSDEVVGYRDEYTGHDQSFKGICIKDCEKQYRRTKDCICIEPYQPTIKPKMRRLKKAYDTNTPNNYDIPKCKPTPCPPRADASKNLYTKRHLPAQPMSDCEAIPEPPSLPEHPLKRLVKRYKYPPPACPVKDECPPRADANLKQAAKCLKPLGPGKCPCVEQHVPSKKPHMKRLVKKYPTDDDPERYNKPKCFRPPCPPRADGKLKIVRKYLPIMKFNDCPCVEPYPLKDGVRVARLKKRFKYPDPVYDCEPVCPKGMDEICGYEIKRKKLKPLLPAKKLCNPTKIPVPIKRCYSTSTQYSQEASENCLVQQNVPIKTKMQESASQIFIEKCQNDKRQFTLPITSNDINQESTAIQVDDSELESNKNSITQENLEQMEEPKETATNEEVTEMQESQVFTENSQNDANTLLTPQVTLHEIQQQSVESNENIITQEHFENKDESKETVAFEEVTENKDTIEENAPVQDTNVEDIEMTVSANTVEVTDASTPVGVYIEDKQKIEAPVEEMRMENTHQESQLEEMRVENTHQESQLEEINESQHITEPPEKETGWKQLWNRIIGFFKVDSNPDPNETYQRHLREEAEAAAKAAGFKICDPNNCDCLKYKEETTTEVVDDVKCKGSTHGNTAKSMQTRQYCSNSNRNKPIYFTMATTDDSEDSMDVTRKIMEEIRRKIDEFSQTSRYSSNHLEDLEPDVTYRDKHSLIPKSSLYEKELEGRIVKIAKVYCRSILVNQGQSYEDYVASEKERTANLREFLDGLLKKYKDGVDKN